MSRKETVKRNTRSKGQSSKYSKNTRQSKKDEFQKAKLDDTNRDNDPNYYFVSSELAQQAAQLSFQNSLGVGSILGISECPTIMAFGMNPCPGSSYNVDRILDRMVDTTDSMEQMKDEVYTGSDLVQQQMNGLNLMATKLFTLLSAYSGRTTTYQPCDVGSMLLALASFAEFSEHIRRAFGVAFLTNFRNKTVPMGLINAMHFDANDLFDHISEYRMRFNTIISRINQLPLLDNIGFIRKSRELYQKVYTDDTTSMAQLYFMYPNSVWILDEQTYSSGTYLKSNRWYFTGESTMGDALDVLETMLNTLLNSSTLQIVYSDLLNMANKISIPTWNFDYLAENYNVMPEYNRTFLLQVHNMTILTEPETWTESGENPPAWRNSDTWDQERALSFKMTSGNDVASDANTGLLVYNPTFRDYAGYLLVHDVLIDMDTDAPSLEDRIESLRFAVAAPGWACFQGQGTSASAYKGGGAFLTLPDHYCVSAQMYTRIGGVPLGVRSDYPVGRLNNKQLDLLSKFKSHPLVFENTSDSTATTQTKDSTWVSMIHGDIGFYTSVDFKYMQRLNKLMYEGLFDFRVSGGKTNNTKQ